MEYVCTVPSEQEVKIYVAVSQKTVNLVENSLFLKLVYKVKVNCMSIALLIS